METLDTCPWCASQHLAKWRRGKDRQHRLSEEWFSYARCRDCGLFFLSTRPLERDIGAFYPKDYGPYHAPAEATGPRRPRKSRMVSLSRRWLARANSGLQRIWPDPLASRLAEIYQPPVPGSRLLDFGCGSSEFLDRARSAGWDTLGMDFSDDVLERVRAGGHRALSASPESWRQLENGSLDLVRLHHVLEHLYRPREVLDQIARVLRPGGRIHIGLPNPVGLSSRLFGSCWFGLECPRHILLYRSALVVAMLRDRGFEEIGVVGEPVTKDFVRSWAYLRREWGWIGDDEAAAALAGPLVVGLRIPMRWLAWMGLADRFHVLALRGGESP